MELYKEKLSPSIIAKRFPIFEMELCEAISEVGQWVSLQEGDSMISEENYIKSFPLILDGVLRIYRTDGDGRESLLYYLTSGQVCSMALTCCSEGIKSNINAVAEIESDIMRIPVQYLDEWMTKYQSWKMFVMQSYRHRFDELLRTIDSLAFSKLDEHLVKFFKDFHRTRGTTTFIGSRADIAKALTTHREVISRLLKALEKKGCIKQSKFAIDFSRLIDGC